MTPPPARLVPAPVMQARSVARGPFRVPSCAELRSPDMDARRHKVQTLPRRPHHVSSTRPEVQPSAGSTLLDRSATRLMQRQYSLISLSSSPSRSTLHIAEAPPTPGSEMRTPPTSHRAVLAQPILRTASAMRPAHQAPKRNPSLRSLRSSNVVLSGGRQQQPGFSTPGPRTPGSGRSQASGRIGTDSIPQSRCQTPTRAENIRRTEVSGARRPLRESQAHTSPSATQEVSIHKRSSTDTLHKPPPMMPRKGGLEHDENVNQMQCSNAAGGLPSRSNQRAPKEGQGLAEAARQRLRGPWSERRPASTLFPAVHGSQTERVGPDLAPQISAGDRLLLERAMYGASEEGGSSRVTSSARSTAQVPPLSAGSLERLLPLIYADDAEGVREALLEGTPATARDEHGWAPLHYASSRGNYEICQLLIDFGSDVNSVIPDLSTPLMLAVEEGHIRVARLLLAQGASSECKDEDGFTASNRCDPVTRDEFMNCLAENLSGPLWR